MTRLGLVPNKFICLVTRDDAYLQSVAGSKFENFDYHNYRNSDINTYSKGIKHLISNGFKVVRLGKSFDNVLVEDLGCGYLQISDDSEYDDSWDVWCGANCAGFISSGTGPDCLAIIFSKPVLFLNFLPVYGLWSFHDVIAFPKWLLNAEGELLPFIEQVKKLFSKK